MKIVVGVLLAINALLFYWVAEKSNQEDVLLAEMSTNMPPLRLLSEVTPQIQPKQTVVKQSVTEETTVELGQEPAIVEKPASRAVFLELSCYSLGPFLEEKAVKSASSILTQLGMVATYKSETRREVSGYWVYIAPLPSRDEAGKVILMLKKRGIKDFLIVSTGIKRNAISLGFFGTRDGAQQHQTRMKALGLNPILEDSYRETSGFWLDFSSPNTPPLPESVIEALQSQYDEISMQKRPCVK